MTLVRIQALLLCRAAFYGCRRSIAGRLHPHLDDDELTVVTGLSRRHCAHLDMSPVPRSLDSSRAFVPREQSGGCANRQPLDARPGLSRFRLM
jgi:hypothetical protein